MCRQVGGLWRAQRPCRWGPQEPSGVQARWGLGGWRAQNHRPCRWGPQEPLGVQAGCGGSGELTGHAGGVPRNPQVCRHIGGRGLESSQVQAMQVAQPFPPCPWNHLPGLAVQVQSMNSDLPPQEAWEPASLKPGAALSPLPCLTDHLPSPCWQPSQSLHARASAVHRHGVLGPLSPSPDSTTDPTTQQSRWLQILPTDPLKCTTPAEKHAGQIHRSHSCSAGIPQRHWF